MHKSPVVRIQRAQYGLHREDLHEVHPFILSLFQTSVDPENVG